MKYKVLKPHSHDAVEYDKGELRENLKPADITHLVKRGVLEEFKEKTETKKKTKKD